MTRNNVLHTCIKSPAEAEATVFQYADEGPWRVHSMGYVIGQGYWILFEAAE